MKQSSGMGTGPVVVALLVVSAVCFGATAAAARPSHTDTNNNAIRLPSSAAAGRPWECCDFVIRDPIMRPPRWQCNDVVDKCSPNCRDCEAAVAADGSDGFICRDWVTIVVEPPVCTPRPWDCCDNAICTRNYIPYCQCADKVESCPNNCKECELVESSSEPPRYRCLDVFHGYPGPVCTPRVSKSN